MSEARVGRTTLAVAGVVTATALAAGCGSGSGTPGPSAVVKQFLAAVRSANGQRACSLLTPQVQTQWFPGPRPCAAKISAYGILFAASLAKVKVGVGAAYAQGASASVPVTTPTGHGSFSLRKTGGRWLISGSSQAVSSTPPASYPAQQVVTLPVGVACAHPRLVVAAAIPGRDEIAGDQFLQGIMAGARGAFGGEVAPLIPDLPRGPHGVRLRTPDPSLRAALIDYRAFDSGRYREFGFAEVPLTATPISSSANVGEAVAIPFPNETDAVGFENAYIRRSCKGEFTPQPIGAGAPAVPGAPAVTAANLAGLVVALPTPVFGKRDAVLEHAVIGRYVIQVLVYADLNTLTDVQNYSPFALSYALGAAGIGYR